MHRTRMLAALAAHPVQRESVAVGAATAARLRAELGSQQPIPPRVSGVLIDVAFAGGRQTPWADWGAGEYFPSAHLLHVPDGTLVRASAPGGRRRSRPTCTGAGR